METGVTSEFRLAPPPQMDSVPVWATAQLRTHDNSFCSFSRQQHSNLELHLLLAEPIAWLLFVLATGTLYFVRSKYICPNACPT